MTHRHDPLHDDSGADSASDDETTADETLILDSGHVSEATGTPTGDDAFGPTSIHDALLREGFRVVRELGRGGMGVVYLAEEVHLQRKVAIKVLPFAAGQSPDLLARFRREAEAASRLDHPNLCGVLRTGTSEGLCWIAMRYVPGRSVAEHLNALRDDASSTTPLRTSSRGPRRYEGAVKLMETIARALHYAHDRGIIHRDLKPGNVMISPEGRPVVLDFGLARDLTAEDGGLTQSGDLLGTPYYMSPEQIRGEAHLIDRQSDVWSLGVMLYELLALERPFEAATREGLYRAILSREPRPLKTVAAEVPKDLQTIVETALAKEPQRRYASAEALACDLRAFLDIRPISARRLGPMGRIWRFARRRKAQAALIVLCLVAAPLLGVLGVTRLRDAATLERLTQKAEAALIAGLDARRPEAVRGALVELKQLAPHHPKLHEYTRELEALSRIQDAATLALDRDSDPGGILARARLVPLRKEFPDRVEPAMFLAYLALLAGQEQTVRDAFEGLPGAEPFLRILDGGDAGQERLQQVFSALVLSARGQPRRALRVLERHMEGSPTDHLACWAAAEQATRIQEYHTALALAGRARSLIGTLSPVQLGRYSVHLRRAGLVQEGLAAAEQALSLSPEDPVIRLDRANALADADRRRESAEAFDALLADVPEFGRAWWAKSSLSLEEGDTARAVEEARRGVRFAPQDPEAWLALGNALVADHRDEEALAPLEKAIALRGDFVYAMNSLASVLRSLKRYEESQKLFDRILELRPSYAEAHYNLGLLHWARGDHEAAASAFARAHALNPKEAIFMLKLGTVALDRNRPDEAWDWYKRVLEIDPSENEALTNLSLIAAQRGDKQAALDYAERAVKASPKDVACLRNLASAQLQVGRVSQATATTWESLQLDPRNDAIIVTVGVLSQLEDPEAALAAASLLRALHSPHLALLEPNIEDLVARGVAAKSPLAIAWRASEQARKGALTPENAQAALEKLPLEFGTPLPAPGTRNAIIHRALLQGALEILPRITDDPPRKKRIEDRLDALDKAARGATRAAHRKDRIRR
ncbi:MAG TPA: serine/threonine-protein kinase [Planctomycetes bacterium]|nr:serine/threonine-protein kinase [Planctomycetota bacterium]